MKPLDGPSQEALQEARALVRGSDDWMTPTDEVRGRSARQDYGEWQVLEQEGWEETLHYAHFYGVALEEIADVEAERCGVDRLEGGERDWERWYYGFLSPLKEAFWDSWHDHHETDVFWKENIVTQASA
jgi:hypothetical protein